VAAPEGEKRRPRDVFAFRAVFPILSSCDGERVHSTRDEPGRNRETARGRSRPLRFRTIRRGSSRLGGRAGLRPAGRARDRGDPHGARPRRRVACRGARCRRPSRRVDRGRAAPHRRDAFRGPLRRCAARRTAPDGGRSRKRRGPASRRARAGALRSGAVHRCRADQGEAGGRRRTLRGHPRRVPEDPLARPRSRGGCGAAHSRGWRGGAPGERPRVPAERRAGKAGAERRAACAEGGRSFRAALRTGQAGPKRHEAAAGRRLLRPHRRRCVRGRATSVREAAEPSAARTARERRLRSGPSRGCGLRRHGGPRIGGEAEGCRLRLQARRRVREPIPLRDARRGRPHDQDQLLGPGSGDRRVAGAFGGRGRLRHSRRRGRACLHRSGIARIGPGRGPAYDRGRGSDRLQLRRGGFRPSRRLDRRRARSGRVGRVLSNARGADRGAARGITQCASSRTLPGGHRSRRPRLCDRPRGAGRPAAHR